MTVLSMYVAPISILCALVGLTNIFTQVTKKLTWDKLPTNIVAFIYAQFLTFIALFAYCFINGITICALYVLGAIVVGFLVAYGAMFGFDKLKETIVSWGIIKNTPTDTTSST